MPKANRQHGRASLTSDEDKLATAQQLLHLARRYLNRKDTIRAANALAKVEEIVTSLAVEQAADDISN